MGQLHLNQRGAHEHNPFAEIKIKIVNETERAIRRTGGAQYYYWPVAVPHAVSIHNCCPSWRDLQKGRHVDGKRVRPLAPVEKWEKFTDPQGFQGLTRNLQTPLFAEVVGHNPSEERRAHTDPGEVGMYMGEESSPHDVRVTRSSRVKLAQTGKIKRFRYIKENPGVFPLRLALLRNRPFDVITEGGAYFDMLEDTGEVTPQGMASTTNARTHAREQDETKERGPDVQRIAPDLYDTGGPASMTSTPHPPFLKTQSL